MKPSLLLPLLMAALCSASAENLRTAPRAQSPEAIAAATNQGKKGRIRSEMSEAPQSAFESRTSTGKALRVLRSRTRSLGPQLHLRPGRGFREGPAAGQAETSMAVDATSQHVVIGFNDFANASSGSLSGFMYSDDGGNTYTYGGTLPTSAGATVAGDPDVKYLGGSTFLYSSILVNAFGQQTMCVHRSTDHGHSWSGPFEIPACTDPNGLGDAADKEFIDVDPETGRVLLSWSNFTSAAPGGVEIRTAYSDDAATGTPPTWSAGTVVSAELADGQSSVPRFAAGSGNAYVAWRRFFPQFPYNFYFNAIGFSRSEDNGETWSTPIEPLDDGIAENGPEYYLQMDMTPGNDRANSSPTLAVDNSEGPYRGRIYLAYALNAFLDFADIFLQTSDDGGETWSAATPMNSNPGGDRAQWFPHVTVDQVTGRVILVYYDQGVAVQGGDLGEVTYTYSDDGGWTWSKPAPLTERPWHVGWGNDTSQPNLGDYIYAISQNGHLWASWAGATNAPGFTDGIPSLSLTTPDVVTAHLTPGTRKAAVRLDGITFLESGGNGFIDAGDTVRLRIGLANYTENPLQANFIETITGRISCSTPGVTVLSANSSFPNLAPGASANNGTYFILRLAPTFVPGTKLELSLAVRTATDGDTTLKFQLNTGTPQPTVLLAENFDTTANDTLPAGWTALHVNGPGGGPLPWTTATDFAGFPIPGASGKFAYQPAWNDEVGDFDGISDPDSRIEDLRTPTVAIPANAQYVTVDFDVYYNTEDDGIQPFTAYDGFFLRIRDLGVPRNVLAEAFAEDITTGSIKHYPRHLPRNGDDAYFEDMSCWGGFSRGWKHVSMRFPGSMAGRNVRLAWTYTQDGSVDCEGGDSGDGGSCGVAVDNVVVRSYTTRSDELQRLVLTPVPGATPGVYSGRVYSQAVAAAPGIPVTLSSSRADKTTLPAGAITIPTGTQVSAPFTVRLDPTLRGVTVNIQATGPANASTSAVTIR